MTIQIFGKKKCFDTKKAERFFKERRINYQFIDIIDKGFSGGELKSILQATSKDALIKRESPLYEEAALAALNDYGALADRLYDYYELVNTPVVRSGKQAVVGHRPDVWAQFIAEDKS